MEQQSKPTVIISRCLGFAPCRYDGQMFKDAFVDKLKDFVNFTTICPETDMGLPIPRETIRIVEVNGSMRLIQPATGEDLTKPMLQYVQGTLPNLSHADGFILKSRSPSCGTKDVKIYQGMAKSATARKGKGFFGGALIAAFPYRALEEDGRLTNFKIREHFLTKLFAAAAFREIKEQGQIQALLDFHERNRLLFTTYNQKVLRFLDKLLYKPKDASAENIFKDYEVHMGLILARVPRYTSNISTLMKTLETFSQRLTAAEKAFAVDTVEKYRQGKIPFSVPLYLLKSYGVRFEDTALLNQSIFDRYPEALMDLSDSGKGGEI